MYIVAVIMKCQSAVLVSRFLDLVYSMSYSIRSFKARSSSKVPMREGAALMWADGSCLGRHTVLILFIL